MRAALGAGQCPARLAPPGRSAAGAGLTGAPLLPAPGQPGRALQAPRARRAPLPSGSPGVSPLCSGARSRPRGRLGNLVSFQPPDWWQSWVPVRMSSGYSVDQHGRGDRCHSPGRTVSRRGRWPPLPEQSSRTARAGPERARSETRRRLALARAGRRFLATTAGGQRPALAAEGPPSSRGVCRHLSALTALRQGPLPRGGQVAAPGRGPGAAGRAAGCWPGGCSQPGPRCRPVTGVPAWRVRYAWCPSLAR